MHAVEQLLGNMLGWSVRFVPESVVAGDGPLLIYGRASVPGAFHISPCGWLSEKGVGPIDPEVAFLNDLPTIFLSEDGHLPFDPFAASFFLLSRYEEWLPIQRDPHGRPVTAVLHAARHGYLDRPVVDEWALQLAAAWRAFDPRVPEPQRKYKQVITVDLDNGLKYGGRPLWRLMGSCARDLVRGEWADLGERMRVLSGQAPDPFLIDPELKERIAMANAMVKFFVLAAERGEFDHAVPISASVYSKEVVALASWAQVGLHPSYRSSEREGLTASQKLALEAVIGSDVTMTRQHFLRLRIPGTFRELESLGIVEEHSLGLHDEIGFRCGTCTPYRWYDLEQDRPLNLFIHPFTVMDNALRDKLKLSPEQAVEKVLPVLERVKRVQGTFIGLWHESFLAHAGKHVAWRAAILRIIDAAKA
ncbi:MAG: hypothetical protein IPL52_17480 [Flavobacteriales bacterium]|nr:hypothetical protein [Flavobacteriales bacterium]